VLWICGLSILAVWRPVRAAEAASPASQEAKSQLADLEAVRNALGSVERGQGNSGVLQAYKQLIDLEVKQQKELAARGTELQEARGQITSLKADVEKLQAAAKQRDGELAERTKGLEAKSREEVASLRAQLEKLEASLAAERTEREKAAADAKRLDGEKQKLEARLSQAANARQAVPAPGSGEKEAEKASGEQVSSLRAQVEKLEASIVEERKEREKAQSEVRRLKEESENLQARLGQLPKAPEQAAMKEEVVSQQVGTGAEGSHIKKWQKADGTLFFGERPPPGSKLLGEVENMGTSGGGDNRSATSAQ
jgi:chromosome segregation ATPase